MDVTENFVREALYELKLDLESFEEIKDGSDTLFSVKTGRGNLVAKFRTYDSLEKSWFEKEPLMLEKMGEKTSLPIPEVVFCRNADENSFFVMTELAGRPFSDVSDELEKEELLKAIQNLGRYLAKIHSTNLEVIGGFGWLVNKEGSIHLREEENWKEMFKSMITYRLESLEGTIFEEYIEDVQTFIENRIDLLTTVKEPVLIHDDFRPGNILLDKGKVSGILDWARASAADPEYDLVNSIYHFQEEVDIENNLIEKNFMSGYTEVKPISENFGKKKKIYLANAITGKMTGFATFWGKNYSEKKQEEIEQRMRHDLEKILK